MGATVFLWTLALLSLPALVTPEAHYMVLFPAFLYHSLRDGICILIHSLSETVHVSVTLVVEAENHTLVEKDVAQPGTFECISFEPPDVFHSKVIMPKKDEVVARLHVVIRKDDTVRFEGQKKVLLSRIYPVDIVETDKPFYKPGDTVRFRVLRVNEDMYASKKRIPMIQLLNPMRERIGQWLDVKTQHGIADLSFPLASEMALGEYTIMVEDNFVDRKTFNVEEYELSKFEVLFDVPSMITTSDTKFQVTVCGKYTYGKPVQGNVNLVLERGISHIFEEAVNETLSEIERIYTGQTNKSGCTTFTINGTDIHLLQKGYASFLTLAAEMEEEGTGLTNAAEASISIAVKEMSLSFFAFNPFYKKGFPYTGKIIAKILDTPVQNQNVYLTVDVDDDVKTHIPFVTNEEGVVDFSLDTTNWKDNLVSLQARYSLENMTQLEAAWRAQSEEIIWLKPFYSESNSFIEIQHIDELLPCRGDQEIVVDYIIDRKELHPEADHVDFYFLVLTRGRIVSGGQKQVPVGKEETLKGTFSFTLTTDTDMVPIARLLLYAVFADGEVVADMETFEVDLCFRHKVKLGFSEKEELPGSQVNLEVAAAPGALCSLHAVDKSVLLKKDNILTAEKLLAIGNAEKEVVTGRGFPYRLEDFEPYPCMAPSGASQRRKRSSRIGPWYQSEADVYNLLKQLKLKVLTNMQVKKPVSCDLPHREVTPFKGVEEKGAPHHESNVIEKESQALDSTKKKKDKPRTHFPDTWIWDLVPINEEGKATHPVTVPDTITEWIANAFCVADIGFGIAQQATLTVFQPFFVDLVLPYSVVRGETFELKATVFNYLKDCIQVRVNLLESEEAEVKPCPACQFTTCLCADEAKTFSWNVTATQLGHVNLSITAEAEETQELCGNRISVMPLRGRSDTVIKSLLVKPEGVPEEKTYNAFLCSSGDPVVEEVSLQLPEDVVKDSGRATVSIIGDILGLTTKNIGHLLRMPIGCGEQNMIKFAPNIFILQYLEKTNRATPEFKERATEFMKSGYQRELLYKHDDGSYSTFGKRDTEGNTWLTAFVAKTFDQAKPYMYVDEKHIHDAVRWLGQHQLPSGCFQSVGRVFNNALKGSVGDDTLSLTAYVTASLLELHLEKNGTMVDDALLCLKGNLSSMNIFTKALSAYVFALAGDTETRQQLLTELDEKFEKKEQLLQLSVIETAAFLILAYLSGPAVSPDDVSHVSEIAKSLALWQSILGGIDSTQRTVLSTQALAKYAAFAYREIEDLKVVVKSGEGFQHEFHVDKKNQLVLQQASLPEVPAQYTVEVSGNGCAYVQTALQYNSHPSKPEAFALSAETSNDCTEDSRRRFRLNLEVSYTGQREASNMALIEVNMLSGYVPAKKTVKKLLMEPLVKKVEFETDKVIIYLDQLDDNVQSFSFFLKQEIEVSDLKAATVKVYDYYQPEDNAIAEYNAPCSTESRKKDHQ